MVFHYPIFHTHHLKHSVRQAEEHVLRIASAWLLQLRERNVTTLGEALTILEHAQLPTSQKDRDLWNTTSLLPPFMGVSATPADDLHGIKLKSPSSKKEAPDEYVQGDKGQEQDTQEGNIKEQESQRSEEFEGEGRDDRTKTRQEEATEEDENDDGKEEAEEREAHAKAREEEQRKDASEEEEDEDEDDEEEEK